MPNRESRRQRRFVKRQEEILDVAARVFAQKGYADTKITEIAEALDVPTPPLLPGQPLV